jgi:trypsin
MEFWTNARVGRAQRQPLSAYFLCFLWFGQWNNAVDAKVVRRVKLFESGLSADPRIVGGTPAAPGEYPFYANTIQPILCGSTLIYEDILLTAAHCAGGFLAGVNIGATMLDGTDAAEVIAVDMEVIHPDYDQATRINDIMLVKLATPASSPVVTLNTDPAVPAADEVVTVIGFGDTLDGGDPSMVLLMVDVNVYTDQFCDNVYNVFEPDTMLCAGTPAGGRDSCQGDSGGPLLTSTNVQIGIVSTGSGCGLPDVPAVYTQVSAFQSFIRQGICGKYFMKNFRWVRTRPLC